MSGSLVVYFTQPDVKCKIEIVKRLAFEPWKKIAPDCTKPLDLALALGLVGPGMDKSYTQACANVFQVVRPESRSVVHIELPGKASRG